VEAIFAKSKYIADFILKQLLNYWGTVIEEIGNRLK